MFESLDKFEIYRARVEIPSDMIDQIYKLKELDKGTPKTNRGGWHSKTFTPYKDYYNGRYKWTKEYLEYLTALVDARWPGTGFGRAWFNLSYQGGTNRWHDHGSHPRVSVLYIQVPENSSEIEFEKDGDIFSYAPAVGDFLVFPGRLNHRVKEHGSEQHRISMAINFD